MEHRSTFSGFYHLSMHNRIKALHDANFLSNDDEELLLADMGIPYAHLMNTMVENALGFFPLPMGVGLNALIDDQALIIPMVIDEASVVAALSSASKIMTASGGITTYIRESLVIGQIQLVDLPDSKSPQQLIEKILSNKEYLILKANEVHPRLISYGGKVVDLSVHQHSLSNNKCMLVVHLFVDCANAMGANIVNSICEAVSSLLEKITSARALLRILSNYMDRSIATAKVSIDLTRLHDSKASANLLAKDIVMANEFAYVDHYRAVTHNKGIMNGIDAVALATGNDWRAIEASVHAWAAKDGQYRSLTHWYLSDDKLCGEISLPIRVGVVGGYMRAHPRIALHFRLLQNPDAPRLSCIMAAVGLMQNFAALKALVSTGIQKGHMALHARISGLNNAVSDNSDTQKVSNSAFSNVSTALNEKQVACGEAYASGKVILLGEHAVVYGHACIAAPLPYCVRVKLSPLTEAAVHFLIPSWNVDFVSTYDVLENSELGRLVSLLFKKLDLALQPLQIAITSDLTPSMGAGSSAALVVALIRALVSYFDLKLTKDELNRLAYTCEKIFHHTPSGVDNSVCVYAYPMLYQLIDPPLQAEFKPLLVKQRLHFLLVSTGIPKLTSNQVKHIRTQYDRNVAAYENIFSSIHELAMEGVNAIEQADTEKLSTLMNINHGLLNALQVSTPAIEYLIQLLRSLGAMGVKLTGAGNGGSVIALCDEHLISSIIISVRKIGYSACAFTLEPAEATNAISQVNYQWKT